MSGSHSQSQQSPMDPAEIARINALPQGSKPVQTTEINENGKTTRITTDQSGRVTITKSGEHLVVPHVAPIPPIPPIGPAYTLSPVDFGGGGSHGDVPPEAASIAYAFFLTCAVIAIGWPIARAFARRIDRRSEASAAIPPAVADQLVRIEQAVEAMSIEVERIGESQRFVAKLQQGSTAERV